VAYRLHWEGHGVYRRFFDVVSAAEFREAYDEMVRDLRYGGTRYIVSDYLGAEPGSDLTDTFIGRLERLARLEYGNGPDIVHATVATGEMLAHVRSYEALPLAPFPEATFSTVDEARQWIVCNPRPAWRAMRPQIASEAGAAVAAARAISRAG
jgi:hypothetical protein